MTLKRSDSIPNSNPNFGFDKIGQYLFAKIVKDNLVVVNYETKKLFFIDRFYSTSIEIDFWNNENGFETNVVSGYDFIGENRFDVSVVIAEIKEIFNKIKVKIDPKDKRLDSLVLSK